MPITLEELFGKLVVGHTQKASAFGRDSETRLTSIWST